MPFFGRKEESKRGFIPVDEVRSMLENKVPEGEIIEILRRGGFSADEIAKALTEAFKPSAPAPKPEVPMPSEELPKVEETIAEAPEEIVSPEVEEVKEEGFAPVFVKLEKYNQIITQINGLGEAVKAIKNSFSVLEELESLREESLKVLRASVERLERAIATLSSQLKPSGLGEEVSTEGSEEVEEVLGNLRAQVEELRSELKGK